MTSEVNATMGAHRHQILDNRAAIIAGLVAGALFLVVLLIAYPLTTGGSPWVILQFIAAIVLGREVLPPPVTPGAGIAVTAVVLHFALSVLYAYVLAFVIHRWGLLVGIVGGALFGLALYLINFFTFTTFFDWFYPARAWPFSLVHILYGAVAGGLYELLEVERFVVHDEPH